MNIHLPVIWGEQKGTKVLTHTHMKQPSVWEQSVGAWSQMRWHSPGELSSGGDVSVGIPRDFSCCIAFNIDQNHLYGYGSKSLTQQSE